MTFSTITITDVANYLRLEDTTAEQGTLTAILNSAKAFILKYTGLTEAKADLANDIVIAVLVLCQDMYDNRALYVDSNNVNKVVETILGMHSINLL